ncbi:hypothetical protein ACFSCZ_11510 [Siminovitchia sediminis]|uniref:Transposase n=1 Tax=Siminovitchia sediminis TaxID=1274353 RepID=A0ABW4KIM8_9BACI
MELMTSWEKKGWKEGISEGKREGIKKGLQKAAKSMQEKGVDEEFIFEVTGLSREELEEIKK